MEYYSNYLVTMVDPYTLEKYTFEYMAVDSNDAWEYAMYDHIDYNVVKVEIIGGESSGWWHLTVNQERDWFESSTVSQFREVNMKKEMKHSVQYRGKTVTASTEEELKKKLRQIEEEENDGA